MEELTFYNDQKEKFIKRTFLYSVISIIMAAVSRLPSWELTSPVGWVVGNVNVGFLPIFGPIIIFGMFCYVYISLRELMKLREAVREKIDGDGNPKIKSVSEAVLQPPWGLALSGNSSKSSKIAAFSIKCWMLIVPLLAYLILFFSYLDFVRPVKNQEFKMAYLERHYQVLDLFLGIGGWAGFKPMAPSIKSNLVKKIDNNQTLTLAEKKALKDRAIDIPWIYPPYQTWAYVCGFFLLAVMAGSIWRQKINENLNKRYNIEKTVDVQTEEK